MTTINEETTLQGKNSKLPKMRARHQNMKNTKLSLVFWPKLLYRSPSTHEAPTYQIWEKLNKFLFFANFEARSAAHPVLRFLIGHLQEERLKFLDSPSLDEYYHQFSAQLELF